MLPQMGKIMNDNQLYTGLFGKTRQAVLALLYGHTDKSFYTKQIMDVVKTGRGTVQRELKNLTDNNIIIREIKGRQVYYRANEKCPIFTELKSIVRKTFGVANVLKESLITAKGNIKLAFIFGSVARSTDDRKSDIDIIIVGKISFGNVVSLLSPAEEKLGREINPVVYSVTEFKDKVKKDHHFVKSVLNSDKIFLTGDEDELRRLAEE